MRIENFFAELKRRNVYKVAVAYIIAGWAVSQGIAQVFPVFDVPNWVIRLIVLFIIIGLPIALVLAWMFELTPQGIMRTEAADAMPQAARPKKHVWIYVVVIGAAISIGLFFLGRYTAGNKTAAATPNELPAKSIAVLPFVDLSPAKDQEYFCDGISEEILDALAKVEGLRVVARTSSFSFKAKNADVAEIAQKLNVQNILEGSLRREGNRIRITAQLVNAHDGFHIWSDTFERELGGVFAVQDEITRSIVDALKIKFAVTLPPRTRQNTEAYDLNLQGLYLSNKSDEENLRKSLNLFQRALDKDPTLSRAWVGIAKVWFWLADAYLKPLQAYQAVESAATKALELNENDAEAHAYLSDAKRVLHWDWKSAERELQRAVEIDPNSAAAHLIFAHHRVCSGDVVGGEMELDEANRLDPLSHIITDHQAILFLYSDRLDGAVAAAKRTLTIDPNYNYLEPTLARVYRELRPLYSDSRFPLLLRRMGIDPAKVVGRQNTQ